VSAAVRLAVAAALLLPLVAAADLSTAARPRAQVDGGAAGARTFTADDTAQFLDALDSARPGDTIMLRAGAVYRGPFRLRNHGAATEWITIRTREPLLPEGTRVRPRAMRAMPRLIASSGSVFIADPGAHHYRLVGLEMSPAPGVFLYHVVDLGSENDRLDAVPHDIRIEQCYIHGDPQKGSRRGVALNGANLAVVDSHLSDFMDVDNDTQAIAGWNGPGPFQIINNYLEASGENVLFGGADPRIRDLVPADIEIRRNHFTKPLSWRVEDRSYAGTPWVVKNLFELKNARRVTVEYNLFEHNWPHGQDGFAILFTPRNQDGGSPWSVVEEVRFEHNVVRRVGSGIFILGWDDIHDSQQTNRIVIRNNLLTEVGGAWGQGRLFQIMNGAREVTIEHNSGLHTESFLFAGDSRPHRGVVFQDNVVVHNDYGAIGDSTGPGRPSLERYLPDLTFRGNVVIGGRADLYPSGNLFLRDIDAVRFASVPADLRLLPSSPAKGRATDGTDPGFDGNALRAIVYARGLAVAIPRGRH
jgi:hypothetical protein